MPEGGSSKDFEFNRDFEFKSLHRVAVLRCNIASATKGVASCRRAGLLRLRGAALPLKRVPFCAATSAVCFWRELFSTAPDEGPAHRPPADR